MAIDRRDFLQSGVAAAALIAWAPHVVASSLEFAGNAALDQLDPFAPADGYPRARSLFFDPEAGRVAVERHWRAFEDSRQIRMAERAFVYAFAWFRALPDRNRRLQIVRAAQKMAAIVAREQGQHPAGPVWGTVFLGMEAVTSGILNTLNLIPTYMDLLTKAQKIDPDYYYGLPGMMRAKLYTKAPPFPVSVGDPAKAWPELDRIAGLSKGVWATWYLACAEAELSRGGKAKAFAWLDRMEVEVRPRLVHLAYDLEIARRDAVEFRSVVTNGTYDKYTWDPVTVLPER